jgi:hypothetical protein
VAATAVASTGGGSGEAQQAVVGAMKNVENAKSYRIAMVATIKGNLGEGMPTTDPNTPFEFLNVSGTVSGKNSNMTLKGLIVSFLGADATTGVEFTTIDGKTYVHGPVPLLNASEAKWYALPEGQSSPAEGLGSASVVKSFASEDMNLSDFKVAGTEQIDGQQCKVYAGDKAATMKAFKNAQSTDGLPSVDSLKDVEEASLKYYICDDNLLHRMQLEFVGTPEGQTDKLSINLDVNLSDFGESFNIAAPKDAVPIATPTP